MDVGFGARLRSQRERQQVPLAVIAARTKIKASLLEGLERDDISGWPAGIFRRSFIRSYAEAIGLQPDEVVREFLEHHPDPIDEDITAALAAAQGSRRPPTRLGYLIASAFSALPAVAKPRARRRGIAEQGAADEGEAIGAVNGSPDAAARGMEAASAQVADQDDAAPPPAIGDVTAAEPEAEQPFLPVIAESAAAAMAAAASQPREHAADSAARDRSGSPAAANAGAAPLEADVAAIAALCGRLARAVQPRDITTVLEEAAQVLRAVGIILWVWDPHTRTLGHVLAHGYSHEVLSRLPRVGSDADNAIADAFRSGETRIVTGSEMATGAVVVPIVSSAGCAGALAIEVQDRGEQRAAVRDLAAILAAQLAAIVRIPAVVEAATA